MTNATITLAGKEYRVEQNGTLLGTPCFMLHGPKVTRYAMPYVDTPDRLYVVGLNMRAPRGLERTHLRVVNGRLEVAP